MACVGKTARLINEDRNGMFKRTPATKCADRGLKHVQFPPMLVNAVLSVVMSLYYSILVFIAR